MAVLREGGGQQRPLWEVIFELRPETKEGLTSFIELVEDSSNRNSTSKGPEAGTRSVCLRTNKAVSVAAAGAPRGRWGCS